MPRGRVQLLSVSDFSGGLNLRDDRFQLEDNETPDCNNVRLLPQGGIERRPAVGLFNSVALGATPRNIFTFKTATYEQVLAQLTSNCNYATTAGTFASCGITGALTAAARMRAAQFKDRLYIVRNNEQVSGYWSGTAWAALTDPAVGATWNEDLASPNSGECPKAKLIASWHNYLWVGNLVENATAYPDRIRWSHPNEPEDWRQLDYIDIDKGVSGNGLTALAAFGDELLVFKDRSIHRLRGYDPDTFDVYQLAGDTGAVCQEAVAVGPMGVAWFDRRLGVFLYDGDKIQWLWPKLAATLTDGRILPSYLLNSSAAHSVVVDWIDDRLFVSVPWTGSSGTPTKTFVYDPRLGRNGAWYAYGYGVGPMVDWATDSGQYSLACSTNSTYVLKLATTAAQDNFGAGAVDFQSSFMTSWFDVGLPGYKKRWRRPKFVVDAETTMSLVVTVRKDYGSRDYEKAFNLDITAVGVGGVWGSMSWGSGLWGSTLEGVQSIEKGSGLGRAFAVQVEVDGPGAVDWGLNAIQFPYIVTRVK